MITIKQNGNALDFLAEGLENNHNKKLELIKSTKATRLKQAKISFKNEVEIYSYLKDGELFGFCAIKPSTGIRWHYKFSSMEELQSFAQFTTVSNLKKQLAYMIKANSKSTYK